MKYRGKYNLKENLIHGRGMGLLKEEYKTIAVPGGFKSGPTGKTVYKTEEEAKAAFETAQASQQTGQISQASLKEVFEAAGHTVVSVARSNEGADLVVKTKAGIQVNVELGLGGKTTQLGFYFPENVKENADGRLGWSAYPQKKASIVTRQDAMIAAFGAKFKPGLILKGADYLKYWNASGDDILVYAESRQGPFKAVALTAKGKKAFPKLDLCKGEWFGKGTITGSGQESQSKGITAGKKRYGFKCFGARSGLNPRNMKPFNG